MYDYATVYKILSLPEEDLLLIQWGNGGIDILEYPDNISPDVGDAILVGTDNTAEAIIDPIGEERGNSIGVVERYLGDRAVVSQGSALTVYKIEDSLSVDENNTVEISSNGIIRGVIDSTPIQDNLTRPERTDITQEVRDLKFPADEIEVGFEDFGGMSGNLEHVQRRFDILLNERERVENIGVKPKLGAIFHGKPGTGKTHFAKILAAESGANFYQIRGPEIITKWVGDTEEILRELFNDARENEPSIIFFDEIDSLGSERGSGPNQQFGNRVVAQLLSLMDGVDEESDGLLIVGSTNRIEDIDDALLRPGRLDWKIKFEIPDRQERIEIFDSLQRGYEIADSVDSEEVGAMTEGWSGADLKSLLDEAGIISVDSGRDQITMTDIRISYERKNNQ